MPLTLGLQNLRRQVDEFAPNRDRTSDGGIGDAAHRTRKSGHNPDDTPGSKPTWDGDNDNLPEWRAWDCDANLNVPGVSARTLVNHIRRLPRVGEVIRFMISDGKIYEASNGFEPEDYNGDNPHTGHIHFEGQRTNAADNNTTFDFRLEEIPVALTDGDKAWISAEIKRHVNALVTPADQPDPTVKTTPVGHHAWNQGLPNAFTGGKTPAWVLLGDVAEKVIELSSALNQPEDGK